MTTTAELLAQAEAALERVESEKARVREQHRAEIAEFDAEARLLRRTINTLKGIPQRKTRTAAVQAGPKAMKAVREVLARGAATWAQIRDQTGLNEGSVSYALRALVEAGETRLTGRKVDGSREYARLIRRKAA